MIMSLRFYKRFLYIYIFGMTICIYIYVYSPPTRVDASPAGKLVHAVFGNVTYIWPPEQRSCGITPVSHGQTIICCPMKGDCLQSINKGLFNMFKWLGWYPTIINDFPLSIISLHNYEFCPAAIPNHLDLRSDKRKKQKKDASTKI